MWLLVLIKLVITPDPHVVEVRIVEFFDNEQKLACIISAMNLVKITLLVPPRRFELRSWA